MVENKDTNKRFIMINHNFFKQDKYIFSVLKPEGFTIYCYLLYKKSSLSYAEINLKMIKEYIPKDTKTIKKYLNILLFNKFIKVVNKEIKSFANIKINDILHIEVLDIKIEEDDKNYFLRLPQKLFVDKIKKIDCKGFSILTYLGLLHNNDYGGDQCNGFAYPSIDTISNILEINKNTVMKYIQILENQKLIKVFRQEPIFTGYDEYGVERFEFIPNHYEVQFKVKGTKYCVE